MPDDALAGLVDLINAVRAAHIDLALGRAEQPVPAISSTAGATIVLPMVATSHRLGLTVVKVLTAQRITARCASSTGQARAG